MMGYAIDATKAGHVTDTQRALRLGQAMDANTMRWLGAFLYATQHPGVQETPDTTISTGFRKVRCPITTPPTSHRDSLSNEMASDNHHQACAIVEQLMTMENPAQVQQMGGGDTQNGKKRKIDGSERIPDHDIRGHMPSEIPKSKWKIGKDLKERDQLNVL